MSAKIPYLKRGEMEAVSPGLYEALAPQFRDRLPSKALASPQNAEIFRATFAAVPEIVDGLFTRLQYEEGSEWPMWKLVAAFYLVEAQIGSQAVLDAGKHIYATMPWPADVRSVADALRFTTIAYAASHFLSPSDVVGCWRVELEERGHIILVDDTPYPCFVNEGVIAGICTAFARQAPTYEVLDPATAKRGGGRVTRYSVKFNPA
jgi:hypothetical protein